MIHQVDFTCEFLEEIDPILYVSKIYAYRVIADHRDQYSEAFSDEFGPLFAWGILELWQGVGDIWIVFDKRIQTTRHLRQMIRLAKKGMKTVEGLGFVRVQGQAKVNCGTERLAHSMGFETEAVHRNYGLGGKGDFAMYTRFF